MRLQDGKLSAKFKRRVENTLEGLFSFRLVISLNIPNPQTIPFASIDQALSVCVVLEHLCTWSSWRRREAVKRQLWCFLFLHIVLSENTFFASISLLFGGVLLVSSISENLSTAQVGTALATYIGKKLAMRVNILCLLLIWRAVQLFSVVLVVFLPTSFHLWRWYSQGPVIGGGKRPCLILVWGCLSNFDFQHTV